MTSVLIRDTQRTDTERGRKGHKMEAEWSNAATAKERLEPAEAGRSEEGFSPRAFRRPVLPAP